MGQIHADSVYVEVATVGRFRGNTYFLRHRESSQVVLIDPGAEPERLIEMIDRRGWQPAAVLVTHGHLDHFGAVQMLKDRYNVPFYLNEAELDNLLATPLRASMYHVAPPPVPKVDHWLMGGQRLYLADLRIQVLHTPGHTPGSMSFAVDGMVFSGDTLFCGAVGRTDFPGGDYERLVSSIHEQIWALGDETLIFPGHGRQTTVGEERRNNPYLI